MGKLPFFAFYPLDWLRDTGALSAKAKAVWIDILAYAWNEPVRGVYERTRDSFCNQLRVDPAELISLLSELTLVSRVTASDKIVTVKCRRMLRFDSARFSNANRQRAYRARRKSNAIVTPQTLDVRSQTLKERRKEEEKKKETTLNPAPASPKGPAPDLANDLTIQKQIEAQNYEAGIRARLKLKYPPPKVEDIPF